MSYDRDAAQNAKSSATERIAEWLVDVDMAGSFPSLERLQQLLLEMPMTSNSAWSPEYLALFLFGMYEGRKLHERLKTPEPAELERFFDLLRYE